MTVVDVVDEDDRIAHVLSSPLDAARVRLDGLIDWNRRFDHMQQHTGQHLLSAVFDDLFGAKTLSVHFGPDYSTLDVDAESISRSQLVAAEERANAFVAEARPVAVTFEDSAGAGGLRKASDREGTLRIVSIDDVDRSACGGTHVRSTAEIGPVLLRSVEKVRKSTRIEFVCGMRAVRRARRDFESLTSIGASLSASLDDAASLVAAQSERLKEGDSARKKLEKELAAFRARERYDAATAGRQWRADDCHSRCELDRRIARARAGGVRAAEGGGRRCVDESAVRSSRVVRGFWRRCGKDSERAARRGRRAWRWIAAHGAGQCS